MIEPLDASDELRQGDVFSLSHFPSWTLRAPIQTDPTTGSTSVVLSSPPAILANPKGVLVAVCAYDCDLENPRNRTGLALAPLMKVPDREGGDRYNAIMASARPNEQGEMDYFALYPLDLSNLGGVSHNGSPRSSGVIDFSSIMSLGPAASIVDLAKSSLVGRLDEDERAAFQLKLTAFFYRQEIARP